MAYPNPQTIITIPPIPTVFVPMVEITATAPLTTGTVPLPVITPLGNARPATIKIPQLPVTPGVVPTNPPATIKIPQLPVTPRDTIKIPQVTIPTGFPFPTTTLRDGKPVVGLPTTPAPPPLTLNVIPQARVQAGGILNMVPIPTPVPATVEVKELVLRPWQTAWAERAHNILLRNHGYIDTSRMGSGKTYVTLWLARMFGFRLIIVCPVIMIDVWRRTAAEYEVPVLDIISYQSLRSQKNHQPKHGYLDRHDNITEGGTHQVSFTPSRAYLNLVEQGVMVVCDEIQNIKNNSAQYKACNALLRPIISVGGRSRFGLLSGTPFDKEEHAVNLLKLIGYIRAHRLYNYIRETRELVLEGMQELIDACRFINAQETDRVLSEIPLVKGKMNHLCYVLYTRVIKASISGAMPAPTTIRGQFDVKNGFYNMSADRAEQLRAAIDELAQAVRFNERTGTAEIRADNIGAVTTALVHIENAKVDDFARVATGILTADRRNKVIISVNYTTTIEEIRNLLIMFDPLILNGQIPSVKRGAVVRLFNENPNRRVLIMNTAVGGVGISLHDTTGNAPRFMLMSPSYKLLDITQAAGRIYRDGTLSDAVVRMFYGRGAGGMETNILTAMARKTQVLRGTLEDAVTRDLILAGDYPNEEER